MKSKMSDEHLNELMYAKELLENPGLAARLSDFIGKPVEGDLEMVPEKYQGVIKDATKKSLEKALDFAVMTMGSGEEGESHDMFHKICATGVGVLGGVFGMRALLIELPVTTVIMLRSIADIARSEGEDIEDIEAKLASLEVLALGGTSKDDDAAETGYYGVRAFLGREVSNAAKYIAEKGFAEEGAPVLVRLIAKISSRFGIVVSEKVAAGAVPVVGAIGGGAVNLVFIDHFQKMARGHFIVRRLEKEYGEELVKSEYERI